jgi:hypothetical protein
MRVIVVTIGDGRERAGALRADRRESPPRGVPARTAAAGASAVEAASAGVSPPSAERGRALGLRAARRDRRPLARRAAPWVRDGLLAAGVPVAGAGVAGAGVACASGAVAASGAVGEASGAAVAGAVVPGVAASEVVAPDVPASIAVVETFVVLAPRLVLSPAAVSVVVPVAARVVALSVVVCAERFAPVLPVAVDDELGAVVS